MYGSESRIEGVLRIGAVLGLIAMLVAAGMSGALAESWDSETSTTSDQSDISGDTTVTYQPYDDATQTLHLEITGGSSSTDYALQFVDPDSGTVYYENTSATNPASGHYAWDVDHVELGNELPHDVDQSAVDVRVVDGSGKVLVGPAAATLDANDTFFDRAKVAFGAEGGSLGLDALNVEDKETGPFGIEFLGGLGIGGDQKTVADGGFDVAINNETAPVVVEIDNADAQDAFDAATKDAEDEDALAIKLDTTRAGAVPVYYGAAPEDAADTHAVVMDNDGDGTEEMKVELGADAYGDADQLDANVVLNEEYGPFEGFEVFGSDGLVPSFDLGLGDDTEESSN